MPFNSAKNIQVINKCLIFNNYSFKKNDGGPSGFLAQNFYRGQGKFFELAAAKGSLENKCKPLLGVATLKMRRKFNTVLNHLDKRNYAETIRSARLAFTHENAKNYKAVWFHDIFQCYGCLDLIKPGQLVILQSHSPQLTSEEVSDSGATQASVEWVQKAEIAAFKRANHLIFPNSGAAELYKQITPDGSEITYIESGCEKKPKTPSIPLDNHNYYFLYIGRRAKIKGYDIVLDAFKDASKIRKDIKLIVAGAGNRIDDNESIIDIGYTDTPHLWLSSCDYLINANRKSYFDLSIMEALSTGTPLIISNSDGHNVFQSSPGITIIEPDSVTSLVSAILRSKIKRKDNREASESNEHLFENNFKNVQYLRRVERFLGEILIEKIE